MVGHYVADTITRAEAELDAWLGGRLREKHGVGLYPGPLETSEVEFDPADQDEDGMDVFVALPARAREILGQKAQLRFHTSDWD